MSTTHNRYRLKRSFLGITFQALFLVFIAMVLFQAIDIIFAILGITICILSWKFLTHHPQLQELQKIDKDLWSLKFAESGAIHQFKINKILNHHFYVILFLDDQKYKTIVIWRDQIDIKQWKRLITRANLG